MSVTCDVSKLLRLTCVNGLVSSPRNIELISVTFLVSKLLRSSDVNPAPANIPLMSVTFEVSKPLKSNDCNPEQL